MNLEDLVGAIVAVLVFLMIAGQHLLRFQNRGQRRLEEIEFEEIELEQIEREEAENEELIIVEKKSRQKAVPQVRSRKVEIPPVPSIKKAERTPLIKGSSLGRKALLGLPSLKRAVILKTLLDQPKSYE